MKHFWWVVVLVFLVGCGKDGHTNVVVYAEPSIDRLDLTGIGVDPEITVYHRGQVYNADPGVGFITWGAGLLNFWWAEVTIKKGGDAPMNGLLKDGDDALTTLNLGVGVIEVYGIQIFGENAGNQEQLHPLELF